MVIIHNQILHMKSLGFFFLLTILSNHPSNFKINTFYAHQLETQVFPKSHYSYLNTNLLRLRGKSRGMTVLIDKDIHCVAHLSGFISLFLQAANTILLI